MHNGLASVIDLLTGLPVDFEVLSYFCFKCKAAAERPDDPSWQERHLPNAEKAMMEVPTQWKLNVLSECGKDPLK